MKVKLSAKVVTQLRRERSTACNKYRIGGKGNERHAPKPISLPRLLEQREP
jgi:hypothetical protein